MEGKQEQVALGVSIFNFRDIGQVLDFVKEHGLPSTIGRMFGFVYEKDAGIQIKLKSHEHVNPRDGADSMSQGEPSLYKYILMALPPKAEQGDDSKQITVEVIRTEGEGMQGIQSLSITFEQGDNNRDEGDSQDNPRITVVFKRENDSLDIQVSIPKDSETQERLLAPFGITLSDLIQMQGQLLKEMSENDLTQNRKVPL